MHVMLDLETWGTRPGSALRSIGVVQFHLNSSVLGGTFYRNIEKESCLLAGLTVDAETVSWWQRQSPEAIASLEKDPRPLPEIVSAFHDWFRTVGGKYIWCHGANFDEPLWSAVCRALARPVPWKYWDTRCTRTLFAMADFDMRSVPREGVAHDALADAIHQARCVQMAVGKLRAPKDKAAA
ncbi:MAG TPA: 3'-5' exonuclease [Micropepsaceae bacterium]|nr:3'-5' exonuclease [Micropepsaceae bacterium]